MSEYGYMTYTLSLYGIVTFICSW